MRFLSPCSCEFLPGFSEPATFVHQTVQTSSSEEGTGHLTDDGWAETQSKMDAIGSQLTDLGIAVEAVPDRVVADFVSNRAVVDFADCAAQDVASCDVPEFVDLLTLDTHIVEEVHDQSLQIFD